MYCQCFAVRSLGWVEMSEEDMVPGKSSVAVNNCIRQLSYHKHNLHDTAGIWGEVRGCYYSCDVHCDVDGFENDIYSSNSLHLI